MLIKILDPAQVQLFQNAINSDAEFKIAARHMSTKIMVHFGDSKCLIEIRDGLISEINLSPTQYDSWAIVLKGSLETWESFLQKVPPPFCNGIYAGMIRGKFELSGDLETAFAYYWALARMFDVIRLL